MFLSLVHITCTNKGKILSNVISYEWYISSLHSITYLYISKYPILMAYRKILHKIHKSNFKFSGKRMIHICESICYQWVFWFLNLMWLFIFALTFRRQFFYRYDSWQVFINIFYLFYHYFHTTVFLRGCQQLITITVFVSNKLFFHTVLIYFYFLSLFITLTFLCIDFLYLLLSNKRTWGLFYQIMK